ncbi:hypothetical protein [Aquibacillus rhizosphaerae]|uniref:Uncharacterized protein n=1 Tax=Aquibacillus rhizosphaerae TaxID=3051431 RepID=A0ABT7L2Y7_9BACI|nr:hypothetical protein [Aquibacillus sp. LR5S19]MDL4840222.1 hypothetical protein [Aquibacillus sp. LR5S19]
MESTSPCKRYCYVSLSVHPELEGQNEIEVNQIDTLTLTYKGYTSEVVDEKIKVTYGMFILDRIFPTVPRRQNSRRNNFEMYLVPQYICQKIWSILRFIKKIALLS